MCNDSFCSYIKIKASEIPDNIKHIWPKTILNRNYWTIDISTIYLQLLSSCMMEFNKLLLPGSLNLHVIRKVEKTK